MTCLGSNNHKTKYHPYPTQRRKKWSKYWGKNGKELGQSGKSTCYLLSRHLSSVTGK